MNHYEEELFAALGATDFEADNERLKFNVGAKKQELNSDFPLVVIVETTSCCNLICSGCPQSEISRRRGFMDKGLFEKIIDELAGHYTRTWFHFMGEPLMNPTIFELLDYARQRDLPYYGMSTNAVLLTDENIEKILDSGLKRFEISLDSLDPTLLSQMRPGADPNSIIKNAHRFFELKYARGQEWPITSVSVREMKANAHEAAEFAAHWQPILREPDFVLSIRYNSWGGNQGLEQATYDVPADRKPCLKLWNTLFVLVDGQVVTCDPMFDAQVVMGDVTKASIKEVWDGDAYQQLRRKHLDGAYAGVPVCETCTDWCREIDASQHKNLTGADEHRRAELPQQ